MVNQFRENQGKIIIINEVRKNINSFKVELDLRLINFIAMIIKERRNIVIPVGRVKKIKPSEAPDNDE